MMSIKVNKHNEIINNFTKRVKFDLNIWTMYLLNRINKDTFNSRI
jgi:hypothetical protein